MSEYTDNMTTEDMRKEIAEMIQCGEGFIATDEKLLEYVDDFISKVRADVIEAIKGRLIHRDYDFHKDGDYFTIEEVFEQLKEQK